MAVVPEGRRHPGQLDCSGNGAHGACREKVAVRQHHLRFPFDAGNQLGGEKGVPADFEEVVGHADCGIYAQVVTPGEIAVGDGVSE